MKILIYSDIQHNNYKQYSRDINGVNSRLLHSLKILDQIQNYVDKNKIDLILFGGDLFELKDKIDVSVYVLVYERMKELSKYVNIFSILGNHDKIFRRGTYINSLKPLSSIMHILDNCSYIIEDDKKKIQIYGISNTDNYNDLYRTLNIFNKGLIKEFTNILLTHQLIEGTINNNRGIKLSRLEKTKFDYIFIGDYHNHEKLADNIYYIGSPIRLTWSDRGKKRGFIVLDTKKKTVEMILCNSPAFRGDLYQGDIEVFKKYKGDFLNLSFFKRDEDKIIKVIKKLVNKYGVEYVVPEILQVDDEKIIRVKIEESFEIEDMIKKYIKEQETNLNKKILKKVAMKIIK